MDYVQLQNVNKQLRTMDVKGRAYVEVNERIRGFRCLFPNGFIKTDIIQIEDGVVTMQARVGIYDDKGEEVVFATGYAQEKESSSYINKTSYIENCETSAVGRALGMLGIGIDTSVASAEEVQNAITNQEALKGLIESIKKVITPDRWPQMFKAYGVKGFDDLTVSQARDILKRSSK